MSDNNKVVESMRINNRSLQGTSKLSLRSAKTDKPSVSATGE